MKEGISEGVQPSLPPVRTIDSLPPKQLFHSLCLLGAGVAIGRAIRLWGPPSFDHVFRPIELFTLQGVAALLAAIFWVIAVHEAGHLLAALALRFDLLGLSLGPLRVARMGNCWSLRFRWKDSFRGSVSALPRSNDAWRRRMMMVVAGGPLATLVSGVIALGWGAAFAPSGWWASFNAAFVQASLLIFVLGLVPNHPNSKLRNDATLFLHLWRGTPGSDEIFLYHQLLQLELAEVRPRDYPLSLIEVLASTEAQPDFMASFAISVAAWAFDRGDLVSGAAWNHRAALLSRRCGLSAKSVTLATAACFDLVFLEERMSAREKMASVDISSLTNPWHRQRATIIEALLAGRIAETVSQFRQSRQALKSLSRRNDRFEFFLLRRLYQVGVSTPFHLSTRIA